MRGAAIVLSLSRGTHHRGATGGRAMRSAQSAMLGRLRLLRGADQVALVARSAPIPDEAERRPEDRVGVGIEGAAAAIDRARSVDQRELGLVQGLGSAER